MTTDIQKRHSPAPWKINQEIKTHVMTEDGYAICDMATTYSSLKYDEHLANARLIAAAPELLEALESLLPIWSSGIDEPWVKKARQAIAKARG